MKDANGFTNIGGDNWIKYEKDNNRLIVFDKRLALQNELTPYIYIRVYDLKYLIEFLVSDCNLDEWLVK